MKIYDLNSGLSRCIGQQLLQCYTTVSGDTCDSIANKYNITVSMLQSMNPSLSCDTIIAGQTLLVMTPGMYSPAPMSTLPLTN